VGPRAGLDTQARGKIFSPLSGIECRTPGRPVRRHSVCVLQSVLFQMQPNKNHIATMAVFSNMFLLTAHPTLTMDREDTHTHTQKLLMESGYKSLRGHEKGNVCKSLSYIY
jgi:hypothetical protein